mmetsp:Transcript_11686/g.38650  ORF Transcript_11686/g.38650 Transcript_11686/m.38650 type:complete len:448 (+) Transcript_11686:35-1378(+)|eukprot:CAMPEP_0202764272 /NCGR_PEP_ID=MMETSP1388-20130828/25437_1 /ASSEMBLY_ACC=CAM_ASM_000864 /TAXON_ID=37098 /ORGANISM="Isochrysis sp, Strain CCMP1244" /LENGTH=447 /DNA_ID=CAMNT_0049432715 /DNA_START=29 /DNA_END=1372 /DNA_ORIENTATION=-
MPLRSEWPPGADPPSPAGTSEIPWWKQRVLSPGAPSIAVVEREVEVASLRDELRSARRHLEAAARREAMLRQALQQAHQDEPANPGLGGNAPLPSLESRSRPSSEPRSVPLSKGFGTLGEPAPAPPRHQAQGEAIEAMWLGLRDEAVRPLLPSVVKEAIRAEVARRVPLRRRRSSIGGATGQEGLVLELARAVTADVLAEEGRAAVLAALRAVAHDYTAQMRAERVFASLLTEVMREELEGARYRSSAASPRDREATVTLPRYVWTNDTPPLLADVLRGGPAGLIYKWRSETLSQCTLELLLEPHVELVARAALREVRGAHARRREAEERELVTERAVATVIEPLILERLTQLVATRAEPLILQRHAAQWLDELCADALFEHALAQAGRHAELEASPVLAQTHRELAQEAMLDEMIEQVLSIVPSGLHPGAVPLSPEETDEDENGEG